MGCLWALVRVWWDWKPARVCGYEAEKYLARQYVGIQQPLEEGELDNGHWPPGSENPADGLTEVRSDMAPLRRLLQSGHFNSGSSRSLKGATWRE